MTSATCYNGLMTTKLCTKCSDPIPATGPSRCRPCRNDARRVPCPVCGGPMSTAAARQCAACTRGSRHPRYSGGRKRPGGYVHVHMPDHPNSCADGYVAEHRLVMAEHLGRPLRDNENVHHVNGKRDDNRLSNLELWVSSQPPGQRLSDLVAWAREIIDTYGDENWTERT